MPAMNKNGKQRTKAGKRRAERYGPTANGHCPENLSSMQYALCILFTLLCLLTAFCPPADAQMKLKAPLPDLCYECHKELKKDLSAPHVHVLFKEGKCITCHNSHVSSIGGLMNDDITTVCLECHTRIRDAMTTTLAHSPVKDQPCTLCHQPHSSGNRRLLIKKEDDMCLECHKDTSAQMNNEHACTPFKKGSCSSCHDAHASKQEYLLLSSPNTLCRKCHAPRCQAENVSLAARLEGSDCVSCHSGHGSGDKGGLGPYGHSAFLRKNCAECHTAFTAGGAAGTKRQGDALCLECHGTDKVTYVSSDVHVKNAKNSCVVCHDHHASGKKDLTRGETTICINCHEKTERNTAAMEKTLRSIRCSPVKNRRCFDCHIPVHSDRPLYFRTDESEMCSGCHAAEHRSTHPQGPGVIDPRNGKPISCVSCHSMHNSAAEFMLTGDRNRALCIQCHRM